MLAVKRNPWVGRYAEPDLLAPKKEEEKAPPKYVFALDFVRITIYCEMLNKVIEIIRERK